MKRVLLLFTLSVMILFTACESTGSLSGVQSSCRSSGKNGTCTLAIARLSGGPVSQAIENSSFRAGDEEAQVTVRVSTQSGALRVGLTGDNGEEKTVEVQPGQTAELSGPARISGTGDERRFSVYFTALDGEVSGVEAEVEYQVQ